MSASSRFRKDSRCSEVAAAETVWRAVRSREIAKETSKASGANTLHTSDGAGLARHSAELEIQALQLLLGGKGVNDTIAELNGEHLGQGTCSCHQPILMINHHLSYPELHRVGRLQLRELRDQVALLTFQDIHLLCSGLLVPLRVRGRVLKPLHLREDLVDLGKWNL